MDVKSENISAQSVNNHHILPVLISALTIPISMSMWIINILYVRYLRGDHYDDSGVIHPMRWLISVTVPVIIIIYGYRKKSLNKSGCILAFFVGFFLTLSSYCFFAMLLTFFITSSKVTKYKEHLKRKFEENFKEGGQRNWIQVLCNGGMATQVAALYLLDVGSSERPIDFVRDYRGSWLGISILGALATSNGDTWASELGTVLSKSNPYLITTFKKVPSGTNGGISVIGTLCSCLGGLVIGLSYYIVIVYFTDTTLLRYTPPQWPLIVVGAFAGFLGSLVDSLMGATLQFSGLDKQGRIVGTPNTSVEHISGKAILDNHSVNLISTVFVALTLPTMCNLFWPA